MKTLDQILKEYEENLQKIGGCTDGGCIILPPKGMHTNGGCRCSRNHIKMMHFSHVTKILIKDLNELSNGQIQSENK